MASLRGLASASALRIVRSVDGSCSRPIIHARCYHLGRVLAAEKAPTEAKLASTVQAPSSVPYQPINVDSAFTIQGVVNPQLEARVAEELRSGYTLTEALRLVRVFANRFFDDSVRVAVRLNVDPRKANQIVRGIAGLPHSFRQTSVAVFAKGEKAAEARDAGADFVGDIDLAQQIQEGKISFDRCIATPDMMPVVGRVARILGPRGLMPNPKLGTVTAEIRSAVSAAKQGQVTFKTDKKGILHAVMGKLSFEDKKIIDNLRAFVKAVNDARPAAVKAEYHLSCTLSSTMGPGIPVNVNQEPFKVPK